eukprot:GILK01002068.1.p1 GENE.GILK01002068.1~~GILK01002068.1.p1  ORF type:complete len:669 (-),score=93.89 GILK01002068.1:132-2138(-)
MMMDLLTLRARHRLKGLAIELGITVDQLIKFIVIFIIFILCSLLYRVTLEGGDLDYIKTLIPLFARCIMLCVLMSFVCTLYILNMEMKPRNKAIALTVCWLPLLFTLFSDLGADLDAHGQYNFLLFIVINLPLYITTGSLRFCWSFYRPNVRAFLKALAAFLFVMFCIFLICLGRVTARWDKGLNGVRIVPKVDQCRLERHGIPWHGFLPPRIMNFWSGSHDCPKNEQFSRVEGTELIIECDEAEAKLELFPDFHTERAYFKDHPYRPSYGNQTVWKTVPGRSRMAVPAEQLIVHCGSNTDFHLSFVQRTEVLNRVQEIHNRAEMQNRSKPTMNVLVILMDNIARPVFHLKMHYTTAMLEQLNRTGDSEVFQFMRYHAVGFNTERNTQALFLGQTEHLEQKTEIWKDFYDNGYVTTSVYAECEDWYRTFVHRPPSNFDHDANYAFCHTDYHPITNPFGNFQGPFSLRPRCIDGRYVHRFALNYLRESMRQYRSYPHLGFAALEEGHEGTMEILATMDEDFSLFLKELHDSGELDHTALFIMSDHGNHMSPFEVFTAVGKQEHYLPFLFAVLPKWFLDKYPEARKNMLSNEQPLVTSFDFFHTVKALLRLPEFGGTDTEPLGVRTVTADPTGVTKWGTSLFNRMPLGRTCATENVLDCVCTPEDTSFLN